MNENKCECAKLRKRVKQLESAMKDSECEAATTNALLSDILPLAMGASCFYDGHPEADQAVHCCDWSPVVDRICKALGRELPEADLGAWYKRRHHENTNPNELKRLNMELNVVINAISDAYQKGVTDWEQITAIAQERITKLQQRYPDGFDSEHSINREGERNVDAVRGRLSGGYAGVSLRKCRRSNY